MLEVIRVAHLDALANVVGGGQEALGQRVDPRVLEVPVGAGLPEEPAVEPDGVWLCIDDLGVLAQLAFRLSALFVGGVSGQRKYRGISFAHRRW